MDFGGFLWAKRRGALVSCGIGAVLACAGCDSTPTGVSLDADSGAGEGGPSPDGATGDAAGSDGGSKSDAAGDGAVTTRGFPVSGPWVSFYGPAMGVDLNMVASTFRVINVDVDPDGGNFADADIVTMRAGGKNVVLSYMNVGSCEDTRSYWMTDPPGHKSCVNSGALTTAYSGYPSEKWANLSNADYQDLIVNYVAPRLAARGIDGFYLDNMEVVEHGAGAAEGPCDAACAQGGFDLVYSLRQKFPSMLIVMQNATSDVTRTAMTHGVSYPSLLDGVAHEEVYSNGGDPTTRMEMLTWKSMGLVPGGRPFWLAVEEYVGACDSGHKSAANAIYASAMTDGLECYVTDASAMQVAPCFWAGL